MKKQKVLSVAGAVLATAVGAGFLTVNNAFANTIPIASITTEEDLTACISDGAICRLDTDVAIEDSITIEAGTTSTLDLNGHTLSSEKTKYDYDRSIESHGVLTITDSGTKGTLDLKLFVREGELNIVKGIFSQSIYGPAASTINISDGTFKKSINGGTILIEKGTFSDNVSSTEMKILDGTFDGTVKGDETLTIKDGTFNSSVNGSIDISNGTFNGTVKGDETLTIKDGTFNNSVFSTGNGSIDISNGTFNGDTSISGTGKNTISGGKFNGTLFIRGENTEVTISGGEFTNINAISFYKGSSLIITGGKFTKGFSIGLDKLSITGGTFYNGKTEDGGWMALVLEHPDSQQYSINGGTFLNTGDEEGVLMVLFTSKQPTLSMVKALFSGGSVLNENTMSIELDDHDTFSNYISYIKKKKVVVSDADTKTSKPAKTTSSTNTKASKPAVTTPDTGVFSKDDSGLIAVTVSLGALAVLAGAAYSTRYIIKRRKHHVDFEK